MASESERRSVRKPTMLVNLPDTSSKILSSSGRLIPLPTMRRRKIKGFPLYRRLGAISGLNYGDLISDIAVAEILRSDGLHTTSRTMWSFIIIEKLVQAFIARNLGFSPKSVIFALFGGMPEIIAFKRYTSENVFSNKSHQMENATELSTVEGNEDGELGSKVGRMALYSVPLLAIQFHLIVSSSTAPSVIQYISICFSLVFMCLMALRLEVSIDYDPAYTTSNPKLCGYLPRDSLRKGAAAIATLGIYLMSACCLSLLAASMLHSTSLKVYLITGTSIFAFYNAMQLCMGNWTWPGPYGNSSKSFPIRMATSILTHMLVCPVVCFIPVTSIRMPAFATPLGYAIMRTLSLVVAVAVIVICTNSEFYCATKNCYTKDFFVKNGKLVAYVLATINIASGFALLKLMKASLRSTFYTHLPWKRYVNTILWNDSLWLNWGKDMDSHRAFVLTKFTEWPSEDKIKTWLADRWTALHNLDHPWFTDAWRAQLPRSVLPASHKRYVREHWQEWEETSPPWFTKKWKSTYLADERKGVRASRDIHFTTQELATYSGRGVSQNPKSKVTKQ